MRARNAKAESTHTHTREKEREREKNPLVSKLIQKRQYNIALYAKSMNTENHYYSINAAQSLHQQVISKRLRARFHISIHFCSGSGFSKNVFLNQSKGCSHSKKQRKIRLNHTKTSRYFITYTKITYLLSDKFHKYQNKQGSWLSHLFYTRQTRKCMWIEQLTK